MIKLSLFEKDLIIRGRAKQISLQTNSIDPANYYDTDKYLCDIILIIKTSLKEMLELEKEYKKMKGKDKIEKN